MGFRTVIINSRCKLELSLNFMVCRKENEEKKVVIDEIKLIIINSLHVSITTSLIAELINKKIKLIFVDDKHNPLGELTPYQNNYYSYRKIKTQFCFSQDNKDYLWKEIVKKKILNQANNLLLTNHIEEYKKLMQYIDEVEEADLTNREGHSAKVYFNAIFGKGFSRDDEENVINKYLNYGYSILLSSFNREIKSMGYLTELGIHHIGESNSFNLSCDFIEPLRPLVDKYIIKEFIDESNFKNEFVNMLSLKVYYNGKEIYLDDAIHLYVEDLFNYLNTGDLLKIRFIEYELLIYENGFVF